MVVQTSKQFFRRHSPLFILPQYEAGSAPALALNATKEKTKTRFANYADQGLLCGKDGLPHLIVDGSLQHLGEFTVRFVWQPLTP